MRKIIIALLAALALAHTSSAFAHVQQGHATDMLLDRHWYYPRPPVPSDVHHGPDMLGTVPVMLNSNADLFGPFRPMPSVMPVDMLPRRALDPTPPAGILIIDR